MSLFTLAQKLEDKWIFKGKLTEELKEYFQAIHENLTLLRRSVSGMENVRDALSTEQPIDVKKEVLHLIESVEKTLKLGKFLKFDFNREYSAIDDAHNKIKTVISLLSHARPVNAEAIEYAERIVHDLQMAEDRLHSQNETLDTVFRQVPTRVVQQVGTDIDEIDPSEIHPDYASALLKKIEVFEKLAVYSDKKEFLKSLSQQVPPRPGSPGTPGYSAPIKDTVIPNKTTIVHDNEKFERDDRFNTSGYQPHDEMIDQTEDEISPEEIKEIEEAKNKPIYAALTKLKFYNKIITGEIV